MSALGLFLVRLIFGRILGLVNRGDLYLAGVYSKFYDMTISTMIDKAYSLNAGLPEVTQRGYGNW